jgi:hypothetical protein
MRIVVSICLRSWNDTARFVLREMSLCDREPAKHSSLVSPFINQNICMTLCILNHISVTADAFWYPLTPSSESLSCPTVNSSPVIIRCVARNLNSVVHKVWLNHMNMTNSSLGLDTTHHTGDHVQGILPYRESGEVAKNASVRFATTRQRLTEFSYLKPRCCRYKFQFW